MDRTLLSVGQGGCLQKGQPLFGNRGKQNRKDEDRGGKLRLRKEAMKQSKTNSRGSKSGAWKFPFVWWRTTRVVFRFHGGTSFFYAGSHKSSYRILELYQILVLYVTRTKREEATKVYWVEGRGEKVESKHLYGKRTEGSHSLSSFVFYFLLSLRHPLSFPILEAFFEPY